MQLKILLPWMLLAACAVILLLLGILAATRTLPRSPKCRPMSARRGVDRATATAALLLLGDSSSCSTDEHENGGNDIMQEVSDGLHAASDLWEGVDEENPMKAMEGVMGALGIAGFGSNPPAATAAQVAALASAMQCWFSRLQSQLSMQDIIIQMQTARGALNSLQGSLETFQQTYQTVATEMFAPTLTPASMPLVLSEYQALMGFTNGPMFEVLTAANTALVAVQQFSTATAGKVWGSDIDSGGVSAALLLAPLLACSQALAIVYTTLVGFWLVDAAHPFFAVLKKNSVPFAHDPSLSISKARTLAANFLDAMLCAPTNLLLSSASATLSEAPSQTAAQVLAPMFAPRSPLNTGVGSLHPLFPLLFSMIASTNMMQARNTVISRPAGLVSTAPRVVHTASSDEVLAAVRSTLDECNMFGDIISSSCPYMSQPANEFGNGAGTDRASSSLSGTLASPPEKGATYPFVYNYNMARMTTLGPQTGLSSAAFQALAELVLRNVFVKFEGVDAPSGSVLYRHGTGPWLLTCNTGDDCEGQLNYMDTLNAAPQFGDMPSSKDGSVAYAPGHHWHIKHVTLMMAAGSFAGLGLHQLIVQMFGIAFPGADPIAVLQWLAPNPFLPVPASAASAISASYQTDPADPQPVTRTVHPMTGIVLPAALNFSTARDATTGRVGYTYSVHSPIWTPRYPSTWWNAQFSLDPAGRQYALNPSPPPFEGWLADHLWALPLSLVKPALPTIACSGAIAATDVATVSITDSSAPTSFSLPDQAASGCGSAGGSLRTLQFRASSGGDGFLVQFLDTSGKVLHTLTLWAHSSASAFDSAGGASIPLGDQGPCANGTWWTLLAFAPDWRSVVLGRSDPGYSGRLYQDTPPLALSDAVTSVAFAPLSVPNVRPMTVGQLSWQPPTQWTRKGACASLPSGSCAANLG
jgi:hypothetical protein